MLELGPSGSVRGALSNERPYRDSARIPLARIHAWSSQEPARPGFVLKRSSRYLTACTMSPFMSAAIMRAQSRRPCL